MDEQAKPKSNVIPLGGTPSFAGSRQPIEGVIKLARVILELAESGELRQLVAVGINADESVMTGLSVAGEHAQTMQGAIHVAAAVHLRKCGVLDDFSA